MLTGPSPASRFDPSDFLSFAQSLSAAKASEAQLRTCVGRAYYAAFLTARERPKIDAAVRALPKRIRKKLGYHRTVVTALRKIDSGMGNQLDDLRKLRLLADYKLEEKGWPSRWEKASFVAAQLVPKLSTL